MNPRRGLMETRRTPDERATGRFGMLSLADDVEIRMKRRQGVQVVPTALDHVPVRRAAPVRAAPLVEGDSRPRATSHTACPRCGARGDLGCDHFAPCDPESLPRLGAGIAQEAAALRQPWSPKEDAMLQELLRQDLSYGEIGERLGRCASSIGSRLQTLRSRANATAQVTASRKPSNAGGQYRMWGKAVVS